MNPGSLEELLADQRSVIVKLSARLAAAEKLAKAAKAITRRHYETFGGCVDGRQLPIGDVWALREALDELEKLQ